MATRVVVVDLVASRLGLRWHSVTRCVGGCRAVTDGGTIHSTNRSRAQKITNQCRALTNESHHNLLCAPDAKRERQKFVQTELNSPPPNTSRVLVALQLAVSSKALLISCGSTVLCLETTSYASKLAHHHRIGPFAASLPHAYHGCCALSSRILIVCAYSLHLSRWTRPPSP